jgi:hypothetical protein
MGLIHRAKGFTGDMKSEKTGVSPDVPVIAPQKKSGLLRKVAYASAYDAIACTLDEFLLASARERAGILFGDESGGMKLLFPKGFDFTTSRRFIPKASFLSSRVSQDHWDTIDGANLEDWQSYFSNTEFTGIRRILLRSVTLGEGIRCYIALTESYLDVTRQYPDIDSFEDAYQSLSASIAANVHVLQSLARIESINKSLEAKKSHIESALAAKKSATLVTISCKDLYDDEETFITDGNLTVIYGAIAHQIARLAGSTNVIEATPEGIIRVVLFTALPADVVLYARALMKPLERLFGLERVSRIAVTDSGTAHALSDILGFLAGER